MTDILSPLDEWLACKFEPRYLPATIDELVAAAAIRELSSTPVCDFEGQLADSDRKLAWCRAALDAGADPASVARWITETEAERARLKLQARQIRPKQAMSTDEIASVVNRRHRLLPAHALRHPGGCAAVRRDRIV